MFLIISTKIRWFVKLIQWINKWVLRLIKLMRQFNKLSCWLLKLICIVFLKRSNVSLNWSYKLRNWFGEINFDQAVIEFPFWSNTWPEIRYYLCLWRRKAPQTLSKALDVSSATVPVAPTKVFYSCNSNYSWTTSENINDFYLAKTIAI